MFLLTPLPNSRMPSTFQELHISNSQASCIGHSLVLNISTGALFLFGVAHSDHKWQAGETGSLQLCYFFVSSSSFPSFQAQRESPTEVHGARREALQGPTALGIPSILCLTS